MVTRITTETVKRDDGDMSGKDIREWKLESDPNTVIIRMNHGTGFVMLGTDDVEDFVKDLRRAALMARDLSKPQ